MTRLLRPTLQDLDFIQADRVDLAFERNIDRVDAGRENPEGCRYGFTNGFWRSSVRGLGPPASDDSPAGSRRPPHKVRLAEPAAWTRPQNVEAFALRVTRMNARTRCRLPVGYRTGGLCVAAPRPAGVAARAPSPIPVSKRAVNVTAVDDTIESRDVSTTSRDDLGRLKTSMTSLPTGLAVSVSCVIGTSKPGGAGRFNGVYGRFTGLSKTSQNVRRPWESTDLAVNYVDRYSPHHDRRRDARNQEQCAPASSEPAGLCPQPSPRVWVANNHRDMQSSGSAHSNRQGH